MERAKEYTSEELQWLSENRLSKFNNRITPSWIRELSENEIFVFGSNVNGFHGGGAARFAMNKFGAVWGNGAHPIKSVARLTKISTIRGRMSF